MMHGWLMIWKERFCHSIAESKFSKRSLDLMNHPTLNPLHPLFDKEGNGVHTKVIEGSWNALNLHFFARNCARENTLGLLVGYIWCRNNKHRVRTAF